MALARVTVWSDDMTSYASRSEAVARRSRPAIDESGQTFEDFYLHEYRAVVGLAYALSGSRAGAEDLAQEAFFAAHKDWGRVGGYDEPGVWVRRVVANLSVSLVRRRVVEAKALARIALGGTPPLPELSAADEEFWRAVRSLPRRQSQVIALHYLEDKPVAEVARILGTAEGTVKKHPHDGRRALAQRLRLEEDEA
jgi:RNA polymerase sigma-70 factor, ECF subfamily